MISVVLAAVSIAAQKPDFSSFMFYTGTWRCWEVRGPAHPHTAVVTVDPGGIWMLEHDYSPPSPAVTAKRYLTYDRSIKRWVEVGVSARGGYWVASAPGWVGDTIVFTTKSLDGATETDVITKDSPTQRHDNYRSVDSKGDVRTGMSRCTKS